jgi:hypothetical protein
VKPGETWKHEDVNSEIHVLDQGKTVQLHRVICSQCVYTYFDLLRKEQRRSLVEVQWKLELEYDEIGNPRSAI